MESSPREWGKHVYEVGFLLVPSLPEERIGAEVQAIKSIIEKADGEYITEQAPALITLTYRMTAVGQKQSFDKGYFGSIKFNASAPAIEVIKRQCQQYPHFLRFMIIKTVVESEPASKPSLKVVASDSSKVFTPAALAIDAPIKSDINEVELDKSIEKLIVE